MAPFGLYKKFNRGQFKKGQKFLANGKPIGRSKGCTTWNAGLAGKDDIRCRMRPEVNEKIRNALKGRKMPWLEATYRRGIDISKYEYVKCKICKKEFFCEKNTHRIYCSVSCKNSDKQLSKLVGIKSKATNIKNKFYQKMSIRMKNGGAVKALKGNKRISRPQRRMFNQLGGKYNKELEYEYPVKIKNRWYSLDTAFPKDNVAFEFHGKYWHKNPKLDAIRHRTLVCAGWRHFVYNEDNLHELKLANEEANLILQDRAMEAFRYLFKLDKVYK